jgi:transposase-like protein
LTIYRDKKAIRQHGLPDKMTIDKSGASTAALDALNDEPKSILKFVKASI